MILFILFLSTSAFAQSTVNLEQAFASALTKNESAAQAKEQVIQAKERYDQAKSGPMPTVTYNYEYLWQPEVNDPLAREFSPERQRSSYLQATQPIFRGLREFAGLRRQSDLLDAQRELQVGALSDLYESVAVAYYDVLLFEQDLRNLNEQLEIYGVRVKDLLNRSRRGESARNEALTAQSNQAAVEAEIQIVQNRLRSARQTFAYLTGLPPETKLTDEGDKLPAVEALDSYVARVESRPDVRAAILRADAAKEDVSMSKGNFWPTADLVGNYYFERPGFLGEIDWDVKLTLKWALFEGGLRYNETQEASSKKRQAELEVSRVRREALSEINSLHESVRLRVTQLEALKRSTELARNSYQTLQRDFRRGLTRNIDVQLAQSDYRVISRSFDQARFAARLDKIRLDLASAKFPASIEGSKQ